MSREAEALRELVNGSDNIVFFGGAGVSTESGIPDFRSVDGLYSQSYDYPPETILSHSFIMEKPEIYFKFHREKLYIRDARPNAAHEKLAELEQIGKLKAVVTQNIDGLHQLAGSRNVLELHGNANRFYCLNCGKKYTQDILDWPGPVPHCDCGGLIRPDVVLYEERLDNDVLYAAVEYIRACDVLIVGGTSLVVYPAAGLVDYYRGSKLVLINRDTTHLDNNADLLINAKIGEILGSI